jgi:phosphoglycolate phosphatase-like HAD superfamily hydrolase
MTCAVLLDLDGTLIDSYPGILGSYVAALRALGHEPDETLELRHLIGPPLEDMMQVLLRSYGIAGSRKRSPPIVSTTGKMDFSAACPIRASAHRLRR